MTPTDVKELLKRLLVEESFPVDVVDIPPLRNLEATYSTTEARIKDVINQWNKDGKNPCASTWKSRYYGILYENGCFFTCQGIAGIRND